jgi:hypothetical protein
MLVTVLSVAVNHEHRDSIIHEIKSGTLLPSITTGVPPALLPQHNISRHRPNNYPSLTQTFCYIATVFSQFHESQRLVPLSQYFHITFRSSQPTTSLYSQDNRPSVGCTSNWISETQRQGMGGRTQKVTLETFTTNFASWFHYNLLTKSLGALHNQAHSEVSLTGSTDKVQLRFAAVRRRVTW